MKWLADKWPSLLAVVLAGIIIYIQLVPRPDDVQQKQIDLLQKDNEALRAQRDSIAVIAEKSIPLAVDYTVKDSLDKVNNKLLYEILKNNRAALDTATAGEIGRRYAAIPR